MRSLLHRTDRPVVAGHISGIRRRRSGAGSQQEGRARILRCGAQRKDFDAAAKFFGPHYIQHNPTAPDGIEGFKRSWILRGKFPDSHSEIKRAFADGDYVIVHVHSVREKGTRGRAIVDIFRLERQDCRALGRRAGDSEKAANTNGMF